MKTPPGQQRRLNPPTSKTDLDLSPFLKIDMVDTIQPIVTSPAVDTTPAVKVEYISVDGPYTRKKDGAQIMFCRQERDVTFDLETGEMIDDTQSWMLPYTPEKMDAIQGMIAKFGKVYRTIQSK